MNYNDKYQPHYQGKEHKVWRRQVMMRDDYLCQHCKKKGIIRAAKQAHHIIPLEEDFSKRFDLDNGIALCRSCHNDAHERRSQLSRFLEEWED